MEAIGTTIPRTLDIETEAILAIQKYEPEDGYYVAFSGGKDSIVIYDLVKRSGAKFDSHMNLTGIDAPEVVKFVRDNYPEVIRHKPKMPMFKLIIKKGIPPTRVIRYCCHELKEIGGAGRVVVLGLRKQESIRRRDRELYEESKRTKNKMFLNPIIEWSEQDVWDYIMKYRLKYPSLYDEGYNRIGCIMCPMASSKEMLKEKERYPKFYEAYIRTFEKMLKRRKELGKRPFYMGRYSQQIAKTGEDVMNWWIYGGIKKKESKEEKLKWFNELGGK